MKIVTSIMVVAAFLTISACSSGNTEVSKDNQVQKLQAELATAKKENEALKSVSNGNSQSADSKIEAATDKYPTISKGTPVTIKDYAEITVKDTKFAKKIIPSNASGLYSLYESKEADSTYFALILKAKNLGSSGVDSSKVAIVNLKFDNKYDYETFSTIEEKGGEDFGYTRGTDIDPLKTATLYYLVKVPNEVAKSTKPLNAEILVQDKIYNYKVR
ncbi:bZIP transcription factor [Paenibacillus sp. FSL R10-2782]|uniref:bZIP transcription factor n=1 Tax=Paenibacillus sp. FSL R10-2782 TaxID=2954661 RepID=UPI003157F4A5